MSQIPGNLVAAIAEGPEKHTQTGLCQGEVARDGLTSLG
jgi:hypothetical protein